MLGTTSSARGTVAAHAALALRCEANLDALRIAGDAGLTAAHDALDDDPDAAAVLAILLAESAPATPSAARLAVALLHDDAPEIRQAAWWGLRLAPAQAIEPHLRTLAERGAWTPARAAALDILAFHRLPVRTPVPEPPREDGDEVAWLLAEAGGRVPGAWTAAHLARYLAHDSARVREAALRASARSGLPQLAAVCRGAVAQGGPAEAIAFLGVVGGTEDVDRLLHAATHRRTAVAAVRALGRLGSPAAVPALLYCLGESRTTAAAVAAILRVTGEDVPRGAPEPPPPGLTEDQLDEWEPHAPIDLGAAAAWWRDAAPRYDPARRYQHGLCVSDDPLGVLDRLPLDVRTEVYLRERALAPGTPDWELETWPWRQRGAGRPGT